MGSHYIPFLPVSNLVFGRDRGVLPQKHWNLAALKHHHCPLKHLANSYFGQDRGEVCLQPQGNVLSKIPGPRKQTGIFSPRSSCLQQIKCFLHFSAVPSPQKPSSKVVLDRTCRSEHIKGRAGPDRQAGQRQLPPPCTQARQHLAWLPASWGLHVPAEGCQVTPLGSLPLNS